MANAIMKVDDDSDIKGLSDGNGLTNGNGITNGNGLTDGNGLTNGNGITNGNCLLYTSPSPRDVEESRMPSSA